MLRDGGGARVTKSRERRKTMEREENETRLVVVIYKEKNNKWAQKTRRPKIMGIQLVRTPRFSGWLLKIRNR